MSKHMYIHQKWQSLPRTRIPFLKWKYDASCFKRYTMFECLFLFYTVVLYFTHPFDVAVSDSTLLSSCEWIWQISWRPRIWGSEVRHAHKAVVAVLTTPCILEGNTISIFKSNTTYRKIIETYALPICKVLSGKYGQYPHKKNQCQPGYSSHALLGLTTKYDIAAGLVLDFFALCWVQMMMMGRRTNIRSLPQGRKTW